MEAIPLVFVVIWLVFGILSLLGTAFWIWMIVECATKEPDKGNDKIVWILILIFTHLLGAILYFAIRRPERIKQYGR